MREERYLLNFDTIKKIKANNTNTNNNKHEDKHFPLNF